MTKKPCECNPPRFRMDGACVAKYDRAKDCHFCYRFATDKALNLEWGGPGAVLPECSPPRVAHVDEARAAINPAVVSQPSPEMIERIRIQLQVVPRDACRHEGPISETCNTCNQGVSDQNHVRACHHPKPSPKGTVNELGESVADDRDFMTRNNHNNTLQRCWNCPDYESPNSPAPLSLPERVVLDQGAGGLGDAILGLLAVTGLKREHPSTRVVYNVGEPVIPFVKLFHGPDEVGASYKSHNDKPVPGARQVNMGYYSHEAAVGPERPRWERYRDNVGARSVAIPPLRDPAAVDAACPEKLRGRVLLFPLTTDPGREWPLFKWIRLERALVKAGYEVGVVVDEDRVDGFTSPVVVRLSPIQLVGAVKNARFVVGNDSGPAHVAGIVGTPAQVVGGWWSMVNIFGAYSSVKWTQAVIPGQTPAAVPWESVYGDIDARMMSADVGGYSLLDPDRLRTIRDAVASTRHLSGVLAELGTFRGGVARLMGLTDPRPWLFIFDTFAGLPEDDAHIQGAHKKGEFAASWEDVKKALAPLKNTLAPVKGRFPESVAATGLNTLIQYRVVHVDGDTYQTTKDAIAFFAPRMVAGGIMIFDDYDWPACPGVKLAVDAAFPGRVEKTTATQARVRF